MPCVISSFTCWKFVMLKIIRVLCSFCTWVSLWPPRDISCCYFTEYFLSVPSGIPEMPMLDCLMVAHKPWMPWVLLSFHLIICHCFQSFVFYPEYCLLCFCKPFVVFHCISCRVYWTRRFWCFCLIKQKFLSNINLLAKFFIHITCRFLCFCVLLSNPVIFFPCIFSRLIRFCIFNF